MRAPSTSRLVLLLTATSIGRLGPVGIVMVIVVRGALKDPKERSKTLHDRQLTPLRGRPEIGSYHGRTCRRP